MKVIPFVLILLIPFLSFAQVRVSKVENKNVNTSSDGFFYTLPQTVLKIELVFQKIEQIKGPLSDYTEDYLGTTEYIRKDEQQYKVLDIKLSQELSADPNQIYHVQFPLERSKDNGSQSFSFSDQGYLLAVNDETAQDYLKKESINHTLIFQEGDDSFQYDAAYHRKRKVDTVVRKITIDTLSFNRFLFKTSWVDKSAREKADEAAMQINKIRENRFNLITGYHEVNYGEAMAYMDKQLTDLEQDYLELFLGKEVKSTEIQTIYYIPNPNTSRWELYKFPDGTTVNIDISQSSLSDQLPSIGDQKMNTVYYRIPSSSFIEISSGGKLMYTSKMPVCQLGPVVAAPIDKTKLRFDPTNGNLIRIERSNN